MVFPEGERSYDGSLNDFFQGFARIALRSEVPVIRVTIRGAIQVWPRSQWLPRFGKVRLTFHAPLHPADFAVPGTGADFMTARFRATMEDALGPGSVV